MKTYLVTFRNKKTSTIVGEVKVEMEEKSVEKSKSVLVLSALEKIKSEGRTLPDVKKCSWSYNEI